MPLVTFGTDGIPAALAVLSEYCLVREDIDSFSELSAWPNSKNLFAEVDSKVIKISQTLNYKLFIITIMWRWISNRFKVLTEMCSQSLYNIPNGFQVLAQHVWSLFTLHIISSLN